MTFKFFFSERTDEFTKEVIKDYAYAQEMGWMRNDIKLDFFLYFSCKIGEMIYDPHLVSLYDNTQDLIMKITNLSFYEIFSRYSEKK